MPAGARARVRLGGGGVAIGHAQLVGGGPRRGARDGAGMQSRAAAVVGGGHGGGAGGGGATAPGCNPGPRPAWAAVTAGAAGRVKSVSPGCDSFEAARIASLSVALP